jgi:hypothetical protein
MPKHQLSRVRLHFTALVTLAVWVLLAWGYVHGGVPSPHLLHRADMPAVSNWWGALLLPAMAWFLSGLTLRRVIIHSSANGVAPRLPTGVIYGFCGSLLSGVLLSVAFVNGHDAVASYMFLGALVIALVLPIYRAEYVLGFVLGMTFSFGAVLPAFVGSAIAAVSAVFHLLVRPTLARVVTLLKRMRSYTSGRPN